MRGEREELVEGNGLSSDDLDAERIGNLDKIY
jgi:hypothetical protein